MNAELPPAVINPSAKSNRTEYTLHIVVLQRGDAEPKTLVTINSSGPNAEKFLDEVSYWQNQVIKIARQHTP